MGNVGENQRRKDGAAGFKLSALVAIFSQPPGRQFSLAVRRRTAQNQEEPIALRCTRLTLSAIFFRQHSFLAQPGNRLHGK